MFATGAKALRQAARGKWEAPSAAEISRARAIARFAGWTCGALIIAGALAGLAPGLFGIRSLEIEQVAAGAIAIALLVGVASWVAEAGTGLAELTDEDRKQRDICKSRPCCGLYLSRCQGREPTHGEIKMMRELIEAEDAGRRA